MVIPSITGVQGMIDATMRLALKRFVICQLVLREDDTCSHDT